MKPDELMAILDFKNKIAEMTNEQLAKALWEVRILEYIPKNSAEEIVLDETIKRLRGF